MPQPSLHEMLFGNVAGGIDLHQVSEESPVILSVLDNRQSMLNTRVGTLSYLSDYGLPGSAHTLIETLSAVLLKDEPRLKSLTVQLLEQMQPGELHYAIDAEPKGAGLVRYGTEFMPEGKILLRHLKQQQSLDPRMGL